MLPPSGADLRAMADSVAAFARASPPEDIEFARVAMGLADLDSSYLTGEVISVSSQHP